jgi:GntR family transcriptional regulator, histidine utilization repressor
MTAVAPADAVPKSLHERIRGEIEQRIFSGTWPPGHRIPSEHELTAAYQCSRMTVNKVLTELARTGLIERRRKAGSFVMRTQARSAVLEIQDIQSEVQALGLPYRAEIRSLAKRRSLRADRERLELEEAGSVLDIDCLHYAGAAPFCREQRLINLNLVPEAAQQSFADITPGAWLVARVPWTSAEHRIRAEGADAATAAALKLRRGSACLVIERRTWRGGQPVTQVRLTYPGPARELVARFSPSQG